MSNILVFDASSSWCSVALSINGTIYSAAQLQPRKHAQLIMPMIDDLCQQAGIKPKQLDGIAFGKGPGSFTGLRIAISVAQGLSLATDAKLYGISSLEALAWQAMKVKNTEHVVAIMNAHMGEVFYSAYQKTEQGLVAIVEDGLAKPEQVDLSALAGKELADVSWLGAGDGFQFKDEMPQVLSLIDIIDEEISSMAESMMDIALSAWQQDLFTVAELQQPVYLRETVAWKKLSEQPSLLKK
ncbi:tRNA (adenosine(37)-N6)-threonylcarbamoyltransferase complex dimerization subunit type 1 TsaB [Oleispira antarctica]|uniref:tRNA threonylcarbamoyladenosine biosynthesis protein TsaB n=1 Tax=Oleispira antarctica TaxID=188908 RepID=A0A1Y5HMW3_OLEAN|nr:tRNA (adenosine(37)-N6)-threonylcarbamoyltransferase complex dimerization subunit type 1 TsaB [Oleispira antarctica]